MEWRLDGEHRTEDGVIRWKSLGAGDPVVLVHGTPYSSFLWRDVAAALATRRQVFVFDHLGYGLSDKSARQDLSLAAQGRRFAGLLDHWGLSKPSVVAHDIGGAIALRALLLDGADYRDLTLFDAVTGGAWERGLFQLFVEHSEVFKALPPYAHEALVASHLRHATAVGFRPGVLEAFLDPWRGAEGQAAFYRQYRQLRESDTVAYESLLSEMSLPVRIIWGREDQILPAPYAEWIHQRIPHAELSWIEGAGHLLQEDAPAQLVDLLSHMRA